MAQHSASPQKLREQADGLGVEAAQLAPKSAFVSELYTAQAMPLVKYLTARFRNSEEAKEIAQEAWLRFYRLPEPETLQNAKAFLFQTASNLAIDRARRASVEQRYLEQEAGDLGRDESPTVEQAMQGREELALIEDALHKLPLKCRQAFVMHRVSGLSYPRIAEALGVSTSMVEKYIIQALKHFRNILNQG
jgi:RNA polymerase sigma-70 factor (ECF subfamily)